MTKSKSGFAFRKMVCLAVAACVTITFYNGVSNQDEASARTTDSDDHFAKKTPSYAKWGTLAVNEVKKRYPQATVIDYLHVGRQTLSPISNVEVFKLWLRDKRHEFGVIVRIYFDTRSERVQKITYEETTR